YGSGKVTKFEFSGLNENLVRKSELAPHFCGVHKALICNSNELQTCSYPQSYSKYSGFRDLRDFGPDFFLFLPAVA
ncbi:MAG: hypothetical protein RIC19_06740, partial [Phaeodactylibacter sp.]|uniref:hypothetical protein n=1 Tax=Phaeodactylibacter sp. TaxID=1940289 RepID=UPI0032EC9F0C